MTKKEIAKLDKLWSELVKKRANFACEYCGKETYLNSHHIFSRSNRAVRWDLDNGCCLCSGHHTLSSQFSAHKTPMEFSEFIVKLRGGEWLKHLQNRAHSLTKPDYDTIWNYLLEEGVNVKEQHYSSKL